MENSFPKRILSVGRMRFFRKFQAAKIRKIKVIGPTKQITENMLIITQEILSLDFLGCQPYTIDLKIYVTTYLINYFNGFLRS